MRFFSLFPLSSENQERDGKKDHPEQENEKEDAKQPDEQHDNV